MLGEDDSGYPYPVASKVVEGVLTELRIPQAIEENRQAIEQIQIPGALTFDDIRGMGFVNTEWVNQRIEATERVLTVLDIWAMGFVTGDWVEEQGYLAESQIQALIGGLGYMTESQITDLIGSMAMALSFDDIWTMGYRDENWINEQGYSTEGWVQNYVTGLGLAPTSWVETNFVSNVDFSSFLKGYLTPEFIDDLTGTLMDVTVHDIKMNLVDALEGRPTFGMVPSISITLPTGHKDDIKGFLATYQGWGAGIFNLSDPFKNTLLVQTLGVGGSRIKEFDNCFRGSGSGLEALTTSIKDEADKVSAEFGAIETDMGKIRDDFEILRGEIQHFLNIFGTPSADSGFTMIKNLMGEFRDFIQGSADVGGFNGVRDTFGDATIRFRLSKEALTRLKAKANQLKTCGAANLQW